MSELFRQFDTMHDAFVIAMDDRGRTGEPIHMLATRIAEHDRFLDTMMDMYRIARRVRDDYAMMVRIERHMVRQAAARRRTGTPVHAPPGPEPAPARAGRAPRRGRASRTRGWTPVAPVPPPAPEVRALTKADAVAWMVDACGICLDRCMKIDSVETCCGHQFCKACYAQYVAAVAGRQTVSCPMCRKQTPALTEFRARITCFRKPVDASRAVIDLTQT